MQYKDYETGNESGEVAMEKIRSIIKKPMVLGISGLVMGLIIGLVGLGWGLWPLEWVDASPSDLQMDYQRDYLCMLIDSFNRNQDFNLLQLRWQGLGEQSEELLSTLTPAVCRFKSTKEINAFNEVVKAAALSELDVQPSEEMNLPEGMPETEGEEKISLLPLAILMLLTLVVGAVFVFLLIRKRKASKSGQPKSEKIKIRENKEFSKESDKGSNVQGEPPLAQFMTTYRQGDDLYDDSFSIDSINGEFLGECGVGIAETIGVGEPKKVTALEVWLFDKNDIQTVTKVLLSEHANNDPAIRQRLQSKGEPIMVEPGMRFLMETASLQLEAKVVDMVYARGPLPENSYFSRLTMEISVWPK